MAKPYIQMVKLILYDLEVDNRNLENDRHQLFRDESHKNKDETIISEKLKTNNEIYLEVNDTCI